MLAEGERITCEKRHFPSPRAGLEKWLFETLIGYYYALHYLVITRF